jgi:hypothetical protein
MKGQLSEGVLPGVLRDLYVGRKTGILRCCLGDEQRNVRFRRGHITRADTNVQGRQLGELMVDEGWITAENLVTATDTVKATGKRLGEVLIEMGVLTSDRLDDALALHVHQILARAFSWREGSYEFEEEPEGPPSGEATLKLSTGELILEAVQQVTDPDVVRYALGDMDRVVALSSDPLLRFQKIALSPTDGFVLSRVDGTSSAREIVQMTPLPAEDVQKSLYGLLCTGIIEYPASIPKKARPAAPASVGRQANAPPPPPPAPAPAPPAAAQAPPAPAQAPPAAPSAAAPPPPAAPAPAAASPVMDGRRQEVVDAFEGLKTRNHYEVLGLVRTASEQQVKEAYFRLAKRFHPDSHHDATLSDLEDKLEAVFIRLGEAYECLKNPRSRADYEERLGRAKERPASGPAGAPEAPGGAAAGDPAAEKARAEDMLRRAGWYFEKEKYWDAIQAVEAALPHLDGKTKTRARVLHAKCHLKNPKWTKRAEENLQTIVHDDPQAVEAYFLLGNIYRDSGLRARALSMYRKVVELKPEHEEAAAALAALTPAETQPAAGSGGLFGKLFKKS